MSPPDAATDTAPGGWPLLPLLEAPLAEVLAGAGRYTLCANDPPWSRIAASLPAPARLIHAGDMTLGGLEALLRAQPDSGVTDSAILDCETVVGLGGGSAMDTAKFIAWKTGKPLLQIPSITSVDAAFTDAIGVRVDGRVRYIGNVLPQRVVLDIALVQSAPKHMNRAGMGDVLSCHTGLWDWQMAVLHGRGVPWHDEAAALGQTLLRELDAAAEDISAVSAEGVRWLASAYRRIGAACAQLRHSRFEEGAEHFLAYAYEHQTGAHPLHGELIALCVFAMSSLQGNKAQLVRSVIKRSGVRAHPEDLGIGEADFVRALIGLQDYVQREALDFSIAHVRPIDAQLAAETWQLVQSLPRVQI